MGVFITIFLYSVTNSVYFPVFQSLVFYKSCLSLTNSTDPEYCMDKQETARSDEIHTLANFILLISSFGICCTAFFTSRILGRLSDVRSRKLALLVPFIGLLLSDLTILAQVLVPQIPPHAFIFSETLFGAFGGFMSITSAAFAIISSQFKGCQERAKAIARLEATICFGGTIGFLVSSQLKAMEYSGMCVFFIIAHAIALFSALMIEDTPSVCRENKPIIEYPRFLATKSRETRKSLTVLYFSFALSYFAFIGSTRILFFYLKHKFFWGNDKYGYLKATNQAMSTIVAFFLFPFLKNVGVSDVSLAIFGLLTRSFGRFWYAVAWNDTSVFLVVIFEMFSKFPATSLRSLISSNVAEEERGVAFSIVAVIEAVCNLSASIVFHTIFPLSLPFFSGFPFLIMPLIILPAVVLMTIHRKTLETSRSASQEINAIEIEKLNNSN